jgi:ketosteroid isomerase-like protein
LAVVAAALAGQGCGGDENSDQEAITAVVDELFAAQDSGDAAKACDEVYVIQEPGRSGEAEGEEGEAEAEGADSCEGAFEAANERRQAEVKDLSSDISSVEVDGDEATAIVHTELERTDGSHLSQDVPYDLVRTPDGWRIRISEEG